MSDYNKPVTLHVSRLDKSSWFGYFYFYFAGHTAGLSMSAGGANR